MTFDNSKTIISLRIKLFAVTVIFIAYLILAYAAEIIKFPLLGMSDTVWTIILTSLSGASCLFNLVPELSVYIFFRRYGEDYYQVFHCRNCRRKKEFR